MRKAGWDLQLWMREAVRNGEVVTLSDSQMIRWIDEINGNAPDELYERIRAVRKMIRYIKAQDVSAENGKKLRNLYEELNDLLLIPEYLLIIVDSEKDYRRACEGFLFNGMRFGRLVSTTNGVKMSTIVFASDTGTSGAVMRDELKRRMDNGRDITKLFVPAKLEAYRSLTCSASIPVSDPQGVLVVPDVFTHFTADYIHLSDNPDGEGEPIYEEVRGGECENNATDGYGIISPQLIEIWSAELGLEQTASGMCIRAPFTKGMVFCMDFHEFAEKVAHSYYVEDIWGETHNILDIDLILTESMLKLTGSYTSWEDYWQKTKENHSGFAVTKVAESRARESRELNYQFSNCLPCDDDGVNDLVAPTIDDLAGVCSGDIAKLIIYLRGEGMTENSVGRMEDDWAKALMIDHRASNDPFIRQQVIQMLRRRFTKAKLGRLRIHGDFQIAGCDPYILLQSVFGLEPTGLLHAGEVYIKYWIDRGADEVVLMRAPMTIENNLCKRKISYSEEAQYWYRYMPNITLINAWDLTAASLNGCDYDGDLIMSVDNSVYLNHVDAAQMAILCEQKSAEKVLATEEDIIRSNCLSFGDTIGVVTNRATSMYDIRSLFSVESDEYKELSKRLAMSQHYQQSAIDRAKGILTAPMPAYFYREQDAAQRSEIDRRICVSRKPYFMIYRYHDIADQFARYLKKANNDCRVQFGCTVDKLLAREEHTAEEEQFIQWYQNNSPVSLGDCTSNRIARKVETKLQNIKNVWKQKSAGFSYTIYRPKGHKYTVEAFCRVVDILDRYEQELKDFPAFARANHLSDSDIAEYKAALAEETKIDCYLNCSGSKELAALVLDATYGRGKPSQIAWDLCGDVIIRTLLQNNNNTINYYVKDKEGEIEYKGERFAHHTLVLEEDNDDSNE